MKRKKVNTRSIKPYFLILILIVIVGFLSHYIMFSSTLINIKTRFDDNLNAPSANDNYLEDQITLIVGYHPVSLSVGDINNDGKNDIVSANQGDDSISLLIWNATFNSWETQVKKNVGNSPESVSIGDVNNDGFNDIIASTLDDEVSIFLWNDSISDWNKIDKHVGDDPECVIIEDANNDGLNDIITANMGDYDVSILCWNSSSKDWNEQIRKSVGYVPYSVAVGDVNNDGTNDIVTANFGVDYNLTVLLWNQYSSDWGEKITLNAGNYPYSVSIGDANNDGIDEIVASSLDGYISIVCWNTTLNNWNFPIMRSVGSNPRFVTVGDVNDDGFNDIATANYNHDNISVLYWNSVSLDWEPQFTYSAGKKPHFVCIDDVNNDEKNDIIIANFEDNTLSIIRGKGSNLESPLLYPILPSPNLDGHIEIDWSDINGTIYYLVYREMFPILSIHGLEPIANVSASIYIDNVFFNGIYFYTIVACNLTTSCPFSNCENITVLKPLSSPHLAKIIPIVNYNGQVQLNWSEVIGAKIYYVYRDTKHLSNLESATLVAQVNQTYYNDKITGNGIYYYVVIASDYYVNSTISNCMDIFIQLDDPDRIISGYCINLILIIMVLSSYFFSLKIKKKRDFLKPKNLKKQIGF